MQEAQVQLELHCPPEQHWEQELLRNKVSRWVGKKAMAWRRDWTHQPAMLMIVKRIL